MGAASLPSGAGESGADRLDQTAVRVAGDQGDPRQAAGGQITEEPEPASAVFGGGDVQAEDLSIPVAVDPDSEPGVHIHGAAAFANFQDERVSSDEGVGPGVQRPRPERLHLRVEISGHL